jgi:hypothetical protein
VAHLRASAFWYSAIALLLILFLLLGLMLFQFSLAPDILKWLFSLSPQLPKLLSSFSIHSSTQLLVPGLVIMLVALIMLILNAVLNYDGYAARLICKKTKL